MKTRRLGETELEFSTVGLGTWAMGGAAWKFSWGPQDDNDSIKAIRCAVDLGVNWIDTAAVYGLGHAEEVVGRALKSLRTRPLIATKCGLCWNKQGEIIGRLKKDSVRREAEASLQRLGVDVIDLFQIHWPNPEEDLEEAWSAIATLINEGKIRYAGVCNFSVSQLKRIQTIHPVASLQPPYSMMVRGAEQELLPYCAVNNIGIVAYSPLQKGLLTGKMTREWLQQLPLDDHRRNDPQFQDPQLSANLELIDSLRQVAKKSGCSLAELAIKWVLRRPEITSAIVGARKSSQIEETVKGADGIISNEDLLAIEALLKKSAVVG